MCRCGVGVRARRAYDSDDVDGGRTTGKGGMSSGQVRYDDGFRYGTVYSTVRLGSDVLQICCNVVARRDDDDDDEMSDGRR